RLPWAGGQIYFDPEIAGGEGFSGVSGIAGFPNGEIPRDHRDYLAAGGYGFIIGDGKPPHYEPEAIGELYDLFKLAEHVFLTADLQYVSHPAYNPDRGPVVVDGIRAHVEF
ncbi:MAG: carbohydrate porin, partial [Isosphaeraceae bacterium]